MPWMKARNIRALVRKQMGLTIDLPKARRAKLIVMKEIQQSYIDEFKRLREYGDELLSTNIGSTVKLEVDRSTPDELAIFHRMYICFGAIKENFMHGCRPIIGLDGCFLKGLVKGQLLVAVRRDGNNQMFPIAWSIIQGRENTDNWKWFLNLLKADLGIIDGMGWTIMSDMQKGLLCSISDLLPFVEQRMCARHIYARWGKRFRGDELKFQFWICARSRNKPEFEKNMAALRQINEEAHDYLKEQWDPIHWCQAFFSDFSKCDRTKEMKNDASKQTRPKASHPTQVPCQTGSYEPSQNANMQAQPDSLHLTPAGSSHHTQNATIKQSKKISIVNPGKSNKYVVATSNTGSCISLGQLQEIKREKAKGKLQSSIRARDSTSFSAQESINYSLDS
nr:uncharacterized protein LOC108954362 [Ipomoea batatas]